MTLPTSGPISLRDIAIEFGKNPSGRISLSDFYGIAPGVPTSGKIAFSDFYGKSNAFTLTLNSFIQAPDIRQLAINAGWNQTVRLVVNINANMAIISFPAGTSFPNGIVLNIAPGVLVGGLSNTFSGFPFTYGIQTRVPITINNLGTIAGSGGSGKQGQSVRGRQMTTTDYIQSSSESPEGQGYNGIGTVQPAGARYNPPVVYYTGDLIGGTTIAWVQAGSGYPGGNWGQAGSNGADNYNWGGSIDNIEVFGGANAGLAGMYIDGISYVTWQNQGTLLGRVG